MPSTAVSAKVRVPASLCDHSRSKPMTMADANRDGELGGDLNGWEFIDHGLAYSF